MNNYEPGAVVRVTGHTSAHNFPARALVTLIDRAPLSETARSGPTWVVEGASPYSAERRLRQIMREADFEPAAVPASSAPVDPWAEARAAAEAAPAEEEKDDATDKTVLGPFYLLASDEAIRKAIGGLQFELQARRDRDGISAEVVAANRVALAEMETEDVR